MGEEDGQVGATLNVTEHEQGDEEYPGDNQQREQARVFTRLTKKNKKSVRSRSGRKVPLPPLNEDLTTLSTRRRLGLTQRMNVVMVRPNQSLMLKVKKQQTAMKKRSEGQQTGERESTPDCRHTLTYGHG